jgi:hypothetical protein
MVTVYPNGGHDVVATPIDPKTNGPIGPDIMVKKENLKKGMALYIHQGQGFLIKEVVEIKDQ